MACKIWGGSPVSVMSATSLQKSPIIFSGTWRKITGNNSVIKKRKDKKQESRLEYCRYICGKIGRFKKKGQWQVWVLLPCSGLRRTSFAFYQVFCIICIYKNTILTNYDNKNIFCLLSGILQTQQHHFIWFTATEVFLINYEK